MTSSSCSPLKLPLDQVVKCSKVNNDTVWKDQKLENDADEAPRVQDSRSAEAINNASNNLQILDIDSLPSSSITRRSSMSIDWSSRFNQPLIARLLSNASTNSVKSTSVMTDRGPGKKLVIKVGRSPHRYIIMKEVHGEFTRWI